MGARSSRPQTAGGGPALRNGSEQEAVLARGWRADRRCAVGCSAAFLALTVGLGWGVNGLSVFGAIVWGASAAVVLVMLWPPRVTAGNGWLAVRTLLRTRRVRTDALVGVWRIGRTAVSLVLRDVHGARLEVDPRLLEADPLLWHLLDEGVRRSQERGTFVTGTGVLGDLGDRVDGQAGAILRASGMR